MEISKSEGYTDTERLLNRLCEKPFLKLRTYPNPYKEDGDKICDLIAVFQNHVFIFFDRNNQSLEKTGNIDIQWKRWKKKSIDAQVRTAKGAKKYILSGRKIYLDLAKSTEFPIKYDLDKLVVHKIIVTHGAENACREYSADNINGSLAVSYEDSRESLSSVPFMVSIDRNNPVHIFDSFTLP